MFSSQTMSSLSVTSKHVDSDDGDDLDNLQQVHDADHEDDIDLDEAPEQPQSIHELADVDDEPPVITTTTTKKTVTQPLSDEEFSLDDDDDHHQRASSLVSHSRAAPPATSAYPAYRKPADDDMRFAAPSRPQQSLARTQQRDAAATSSGSYSLSSGDSAELDALTSTQLKQLQAKSTRR